MRLRWLTPGLVLLTAAAVYSVASRDAAASSGRVVAGFDAGWRVAVDPATGEIVGSPTADDVARLGSPDRRRRRSADLERFDLPSGAQGVVLDGWADHALKVERGVDGSLRFVCSQGDRHEEVR